MSEETKEIQIEGKQVSKLPSYKNEEIASLYHMRSEINDYNIKVNFAPRKEMTQLSASIRRETEVWWSAERALSHYFKPTLLKKRGKYTSTYATGVTDNEDDVGKHVRDYIGGYNTLTKRKHTTWSSIKNTLFEHLNLTSDIELSCNSLNARHEGDGDRGNQKKFVYVDFNKVNINNILKIRPEKFRKMLGVGEDREVDILNFSVERLSTLINGILGWERFLTNLHTTLWMRKNNPRVKTMFKDKVYKRPIYYIDYDLKSKQCQSHWRMKDSKLYPKDMWSKEEFTQLYGATAYSDGVYTKGVYYNTNGGYLANVSNNWVDSCSNQRLLNTFDIPECITLKEVEADLYEVMERLMQLKLYRNNMKESVLYIENRSHLDTRELLDVVTRTQKRGLENYQYKIEDINRDNRAVVAWSAYKMMKGKIKNITHTENHRDFLRDDSKSVWLEGLNQRDISTVSQLDNIGTLETEELILITKSLYDKLIKRGGEE